MTSSNLSGNFLIYDEECFFCSNYVRLVNLKQSIGDITLVNARDAGVAEKFNIDLKYLNEGMLLILNGNRYYGAEAVHHIALLSTASGVFNKINATVFKYRFLSHLFYPLLKLGRKTYLFLAGKKEIG
jgi:predicted DCC family thiol-disulfide oxidoreductase YuxK